jgi:DNA polymerase-1
VTKLLAVDTETGGLEAAYDELVPLWMIVVANDEGSSEITLEDLQREVDTGTILIFHNAAFDVAVLRLRGLRIRPAQYHDTMVMSHVYDTRRAHGLSAWGEDLGYAKLEFNDFSRRTEDMLTYALRDVELTWKVYQYLKREMTKAQRDYYKRMSLPFVESIIEMQTAGIYLDVPKIEQVKAQLERESSRSLHSLLSLHPYVQGAEVLYSRGYHKRKGEITYNHCKLERFNPGSGEQVAGVLQKCYGWVPTIFSEKTNKPKTSADVLDEIDIPSAHEFLSLLSTYNRSEKFLSTFIGKWSSVHKDGVVFPGLNQTGTITGRLSSSGASGNWQNTPARGELGDVLRSIVIAPPGLALFEGDMSNLEGRILAKVLYEYTGNDYIVKVFQQGKDFHMSNAEEWGLVDTARSLMPDGTDESVYRKVARTLAKTVLYAITYGAGASKTAAGASRGLPVRLTKEDGERILQHVRDTSPDLFEMKSLFWDEVRSNKGWMYTELGRPIYYPDMLSKDRGLRARAERQTFNARLQGSAADIMVDLQNKVRYNVHKMGAWFTLQVHDSLMGYADPDTVNDVTSYLTQTFSSADYLSPVPLLAEFKTGENWLAIH